MSTFGEMRALIVTFDNEKIEREIAFGRAALDIDDDNTLTWLVALLDERATRREASGERPYSVGVHDPPRRLRRFATEDEAAAFIGTLEDHDAGIYYLDGPER